jgi:recombination protein RecA
LPPPFNVADFDLVYGEGISREGSIIDMGTETGILVKSGAWYSYNGERLGQGSENVNEFMREHPDIASEVESRGRELVLTSMKDKNRIPENTNDIDDYEN